MNHPIHTTLKPQAKPKRFELTWEMIKFFNSPLIAAHAYGLSFIVGNNRTTISAKLAEEYASALEIILQCKTFNPGVFERVNGVWQRVGAESPQQNISGC